MGDVICSDGFKKAVGMCPGSAGFGPWKGRVLVELEIFELRDIVEGYKKHPTDEEDGQATWDKKNRQAKAALNAVLPDAIMTGVSSSDKSKTAFDIWKSLNEKFGSRLIGDHIARFEKLRALTLGENISTVTEYVTEFSRLTAELAGMEHTVSEEDAVQYFLSGIKSALPATYNYWIRQATSSLDKVQNDALSAEARGDYLPESGTGYFLGTKQQSVPKCYKCQGFGHIVKNCPSPFYYDVNGNPINSGSMGFGGPGYGRARRGSGGGGSGNIGRNYGGTRWMRGG